MCDSSTRLYRIWAGMKQRCNNPNSTKYYNYGGKGITVCDEWNRSFVKFKEWALDNAYDDSLSIERVDNSFGYSPDNCIFATIIEQNNNTSQNHIITYKGEDYTVSEMARIIGMKENTLRFRLLRGWDVNRAIEQKVMIKKCQKV